MSTEQLFKEFLKFYNTMNPAGMGATGAAALSAEEEEEAAQGDSFSDIVEKRASAPDSFEARVRDGMNTMKQNSRAREEADIFKARVRDGMNTMKQNSRAREEALLADAEQDDTEAFDKLFGTVGGEVGQPAETPTLEEMQSRNEEFGDSFDFMEGSEEYPAGRDKKSDRKAERKAKRKSKRKGKGKEPLIATEAGRTIDEIGAPERGLGDYAADAMAESAEPAPEVDYSDQAIALFKNTHGTSFDPKSRTDRGKLEKMKSLLAERGGMGEMTDNQFALQFYREYP